MTAELNKRGNAPLTDFLPRDSQRSPRYAQPATFMRLQERNGTNELDGVDVAIIGVPFDGGVSYRPGTRFAPREIRAQSSLQRPYNPVMKVSPFHELNVVDHGDVDAPPTSIEDAFQAIEVRIAAVMERSVYPMMVGGDHSITLPALRALAARHGALGLIQIDAHLDTWDEYFEAKYFHGTPFRRAIEEGLIDGHRMIQIGIRGPLYTTEDLDFQKAHGITVITIDDVKSNGVQDSIRRAREVVGESATYVSFDIDSVDPAFAPATGTPEVGGLTSYEALQLIRGCKGLGSVGFDLVEVSPVYEGPAQITALLAANILFEFLCTLPFNPLMSSSLEGAE
jgi:agmatinase